MTNTKIIIAFVIALSFQSCVTPGINTVWKSDPASPFPYNRIMVAAIISVRDDSLRHEIEKQVVARLIAKGYTAITAVDQLGPNQGERLSQEATYLTLCDKGVDAVISIAIVPAKYSVDGFKSYATKYSNSYYYNHLWNYRDLSIKDTTGIEQFKWEMIVFDITQLRPQAVLQAGPMTEQQVKSKAIAFAEAGVKELISERILLKPEKQAPKAF